MPLLYQELSEKFLALSTTVDYLIGSFEHRILVRVHPAVLTVYYICSPSFLPQNLKNAPPSNLHPWSFNCQPSDKPDSNFFYSTASDMSVGQPRVLRAGTSSLTRAKDTRRHLSVVVVIIIVAIRRQFFGYFF